MSEKSETPWADWSDANHKVIEAAEAASAGAMSEPQAQQARCSVASGSVPWLRRLVLVLLIENGDIVALEYMPRWKSILWYPILVLPFWGHDIRIIEAPNISSQRTRHPMPDHQPTEATIQEQRSGSL